MDQIQIQESVEVKPNLILRILKHKISVALGAFIAGYSLGIISISIVRWTYSNPYWNLRLNKSITKTDYSPPVPTPIVSLQPKPSETPLYSPRKKLDYQQILSSEFLKYQSTKIGFSLEYPEESIIYKHETIPEVPLPNDTSRLYEYQGAVKFIISAQNSGETEVYDGALVEVNYKYSASVVNFEKLEVEYKKNKQEHPYEPYGEGYQTIFNGYSSFYSEYQGYGGSYKYSLYNPKTNYSIEIWFSNNGEDKEKLKPIVNKILASFRII